MSVRITTIDGTVALIARASTTPGNVDIKLGNRIHEISAKDAIAWGTDLLNFGKAAAKAVAPKPVDMPPADAPPTDSVEPEAHVAEVVPKDDGEEPTLPAQRKVSNVVPATDVPDPSDEGDGEEVPELTDDDDDEATIEIG